MYERIYKEAYQKALNTSIMHFEPATFPNVISFKALGVQWMKLVRNSGFTKPPGGEIGS